MFCRPIWVSIAAAGGADGVLQLQDNALTLAGNIVVDLCTEEAPLECKNFLKLCKAKYYNFCPFYNIQKDYVAECGAPLYPDSLAGSCAWGLAGSNAGNYKARKNYELQKNKKGEVAFVGQPSGSASRHELFVSSIFTILLHDLPKNDLKNNVVFGRVAEGLDVLDKINHSYVDQQFRPLCDIRIHHTYILDDPFEDIEGLEIPQTSPEPTEDQLKTIRLEEFAEPADSGDDAPQPTEEELRRKREHDVRTKALTLELVGDLYSADAKPMENVLFVCKLNSLTTDDDLRTIFARFGEIISCDVIRDRDSGDSLQYAFIEYKDKKSCEAAYFKMDGALIDDKRIHVDFSQSVSKLAKAWRAQTSRRK